jgi:ATP-dependent Zn protease
LVQEAFERAVAILEKHRPALEKTAQRLLEVETLTGEELPVLQATGLEKG